MVVRKTVLLGLGLVALMYVQGAHAMIEGQLDERDTKNAIDKAIADRQFAIEQAREREMMRKNASVQFDERMQELRVDSPPAAMAHSPGVKAATPESEEAAQTLGINTTALVCTALGVVAIGAMAFLIWRQTVQDKEGREARRLKLKKSLLG